MLDNNDKLYLYLSNNRMQLFDIKWLSEMFMPWNIALLVLDGGQD